MRICILTHGGNFFGRHYAQAFKDRGQDVHMFLLTPVQHELPDVPIQVFAPPELDPNTESRSWYLKTVLPVRRAVRKLRPDIVFAMYLSSAGVVGALSGCRGLVLSARGSDVVQHVASRAWRGVFRWMTRRAAMVHAVSDPLAGMLRDLVGVPDRKLFVCPIGVDTEQLAYVPPSARPNAGRIICTRAHKPIYDQPTLIRALCKLRDRGVDFHVTFGSAAKAETTKSLLADSRMGERVTFLGGYCPAELPELLAGADVYVSSSLADGTSSSLLEAMSTGLFPIVSDIPANRPWVTHGHNGLLFPAGNADALADQLSKALAEPGLRAAAAPRNRQIILERGDKQALMDKLLEAIEKCL